MSLEKLNSAQLRAMIIAGCNRLIYHKKTINEINVFPVADGDTGDNLSSTCQAIIQFSTTSMQLKDTLKSIADASIIGARGNSGIIFSQFFNLLAAYTPNIELLDFKDFSRALVKVGSKISSVLSKPVQGTIITIIQKFALHSNAQKKYDSFSQAMHNVIPLLFLEVEKTKKTLKVLKKANVVDSGALGFYYFLEGFAESLQNTYVADLENTELSLSIIPHKILSMNRPKFRYCTEAILKSELLNKAELIHFLNTQGDSTSVIGNEKITRVHVHTNNPQRVFTSLYENNRVQYPKVDDMLRQYEIQFDKKYKIALVTDSSADIPQSIVDEYQIHQMCINLHIDDQHLLDKYSLEPEYFYKKLSQFKTHPKTSCLNAKLIENKLAIIAKHYEHVLVLSISSNMSAMHIAFTHASKKFKNICVIDTKTNSGAHGLLLSYAGQLIASEINIKTIQSLIYKAIKNTFIFVIVNQFESMIRSGRINKLSGKIAGWANIKPIVSIDKNGKGIVVAKCFSNSAALNKLVTLVNQKLHLSQHTLSDYCIIHADEYNQAINLSYKTRIAFNKQPLFIEPVSLSIGLHAGKGCIGIAARISE